MCHKACHNIHVEVENNVQKSVLSFHCVGPKNRTIGSEASTITCCASCKPDLHLFYNKARRGGDIQLAEIELRLKPRVHDLNHGPTVCVARIQSPIMMSASLATWGLHPEQVSMMRYFCAGARAPRVEGSHTQLSLPTPKLGPPYPRIVKKFPGGPGTVQSRF